MTELIPDDAHNQIVDKQIGKQDARPRSIRKRARIRAPMPTLHRVKLG